MRNHYRYLLLIVAMATLLARISMPVWAQQTPTGSIRGTVTDPQGAVIQNATITVTNKATGDVRTASTGSDGIYSIANLLPGQYEVKIEGQGFATHVTTVTVQVGNTTTGDAQLRVGAKDEVVEIVSGQAPIIDKENYKIDGVISRQKIESLPLNGRNFLQLAALEPGVAVTTSNPGDANNLFNVSIGGASSASTRITVDGGSVLDYVTGGAAQNFSTETIQEFQISTFNFDLSTGVTSVGAVNIVSRTGSNQYHGSAFGFFRDDQWAAVPTLQQGAPDFRRYQYGGAFGGPFKKDKVLFFGNVEWTNQDSVFSTVNRGFRGITQFDTNTQSPYDGFVANFRTDFTVNNKNRLFARYSHDDNETFAPVDSNTLPSNWRTNKNNDHNAQAGLSTVFTSNFVNDVRFNYQYIKNDSLIPSSSECPPASTGCIGLGGAQVRVLGSTIRFGNNVNAPQNRILNRAQTSDNISWQKGSHRIRGGGEWEYDKGKGGWAFLDPALIVLHDPAVVAGVNAQIAAAPLPAAVKAALTIPLPPAFATGGPFTINDILSLPLAVAFVGLGDPQQPPPFNQSVARQSHRYRFYGQDSWLVRPGFTLLYGASYMYETNLYNHDLPKPAFLSGLIGNLAPSPKDKNNIAPSVGFAWDVRNNGKTVIRGGAGIYYDTALFVTRLRERAAIGPLGNGRVQLTGAFFQNPLAFPQIPGIPPPLSLINPAPGARLDFQVIPTKFTGANFLSALGTQGPAVLAQLQALGGSGLTNIDFFKTGTDLLDPGNVTPYSEQFTIGVQRQIGNTMAVAVDFVQRNQVHSPIVNNDYNLFDRAASRGGAVIRKCTSAEAVNPAVRCSNGPISFIQLGGRVGYRAMLMKLDKRFSNRFQFTASYALSSLTGWFTSANLENYFEQRGNLGADARHRFTFSGIVDLPWGIQASLISFYASRAPFSATIPSNIDLNGDGTKGDVLPGLKINSLNRSTSKNELIQLVNQFNTNFAGKPDANGVVIPALILPTNFEFGDDFQSHDLRFSKTFKFNERVAVQGLVEIFNIFNTANLGGFQGALDRVATPGTVQVFNYGQPTSRAGQAFGTGGPRAFQLGARLTF